MTPITNDELLKIDIIKFRTSYDNKVYKFVLKMSIM